MDVTPSHRETARSLGISAGGVASVGTGKKWKFSVNDVNERLRWKEYMAAYEKAMCATSTPQAPWFVVPS
ncbi:MAG TPA: hypothetical protein VM165_08650 [Planctomycetaceae bacterium]|nr:hypothetical protein [Planctomycetaceae bacterium]